MEICMSDKFLAGERVRFVLTGKLGTVMGYPEGDEYPVRFDGEPSDIYYCFSYDLETV
jgi:hypothetical protein